MTKRSTYLFIIIGLLACLVSCSEKEITLLSDDAVSKLKGKVKLISIKTETETTSTRWVYDDAQDVKAYQISNPATKTDVVETYIKDATGKITSIRIEDQTTKATYERKLEYNDRGRLSKVSETLPNGEQYTDNYAFNADGTLYSYNRMKLVSGRNVLVRNMQYKWKSNNVQTIIESGTNNYYEEEDFLYETTENTLAKFFKEQFPMPRLLAEEVSQNMPSSSIKQFDGNNFKYQTETNTEGKLTKFSVLVNKNNTLSPVKEIVVEYY